MGKIHWLLALWCFMRVPNWPSHEYLERCHSGQSGQVGWWEGVDPAVGQGHLDQWRSNTPQSLVDLKCNFFKVDSWSIDPPYVEVFTVQCESQDFIRQESTWCGGSTPCARTPNRSLFVYKINSWSHCICGSLIDLCWFYACKTGKLAPCVFFWATGGATC